MFPLTTSRLSASSSLRVTLTREGDVSRRALLPFAQREALSFYGTRAEGSLCLRYPGRGRVLHWLILSQKHEYLFSIALQLVPLVM